MIVFEGKSYRELRCSNCRLFIVYEYIFAGRIAIKCKRCDHLNIFVFRHLRTQENKDTIEQDFSIGKTGREVKK